MKKNENRSTFAEVMSNLIPVRFLWNTVYLLQFCATGWK